MAKPISIILADDHALFREALAALLEREADFFVVAVVADGDEALTQALRLRPQIVLLDINMPGPNTFEVARTLNRVLPETKVVFLSAHQSDAYIEQAITMNASGYLTKSQPSNEILEAIRTVAAGGICYSPEVYKRVVVEELTGPRSARRRQTRLSTLTARELEVLAHLGRGLSRKQIAKLLHVTEKTAELHSQNLMNKLDIHDRVELARFAIREGLVEP